MGADSSQLGGITHFNAFLQELGQGVPHQVVVVQFFGVGVALCWGFGMWGLWNVGSQCLGVAKCGGVYGL